MVAACSTLEPAAEMLTALSVDLIRYDGIWYEIARSPMWVLQNCVRFTATYRLGESGKASVSNACVTSTEIPGSGDPSKHPITVLETETAKYPIYILHTASLRNLFFP